VGASIAQEWNIENRDPQKLMLFSDRPVYRPGETLHLKALLRSGKRLVRDPSGGHGQIDLF